MMDVILGRGAVSFFDMEVQAFRIAVDATSGIMTRLIQQADEELFRQRDRSRYEVIEKRSREVDTMFGGTLRFKRRYYLDRATGDRVFLLDEALALPGRARHSPGLRALSVKLATSGSYRQTRDAIEQMVGARVMSHESVRQHVLTTGKVLEHLGRETAAQPQEPASHKPKFVFLEVDGIHCHLQRRGRKGKKNAEVRVMYVHEGWEEHPDRKDRFTAKNLYIRHWRPDKDDLEDLAGELCNRYGIDNNTVVVVCGDRAGWIRKAVDYFGDSTVLYQVDRFHILRDIRMIFRANPEGHGRVISAIDSDATGGRFMATVAEELAKLPSAERQKAQGLINDLIPIADCIGDYRIRLQAMGIDTQGLRSVGATESRNSLFTARLKGYKKSWSVCGLKAMMHTLAAKFEGSLHELLHTLYKQTGPLPGEERLKREALRTALENLAAPVVVRTGNIPLRGAGIVRSGGLSRLFRDIVTG